MAHDDRGGSARRNNIWILIAIAGFLVLFGIWFFSSMDNVPPEPGPTPADGSRAPEAPATLEQ
ncbi:MAG TPA: hypothetical protein VGN97_13800 [Mesorhizobium sp.]|jgi:hypothetical protein|nr:hypothetical protein [Mesorhizobium sp.]